MPLLPLIPASELAEQAWGQMLARIDGFTSLKATGEDAIQAKVSWFGLQPTPQLMISEMFNRYDAVTTAGRLAMSEDQRRKWRNPKIRAVKDLIAVIGDQPIKDITRSQALDFRGHWQERIVAGEVEIGTANKQFGHVSRMLSAIDKSDRLDLKPNFKDLRLDGEKTNSRLPYPIAFVQDQLLRRER